MRLLFADTELGENIIQYIFIGNIPGYFRNIVQATADIESKEVAGYFLSRPVLISARDLSTSFSAS